MTTALRVRLGAHLLVVRVVRVYGGREGEEHVMGDAAQNSLKKSHNSNFFGGDSAWVPFTFSKHWWTCRDTAVSLWIICRCGERGEGLRRRGL